MLATTSAFLTIGMTAKAHGLSTIALSTILKARLTVCLYEISKLFLLFHLFIFNKIFNVGFPKAGTCSIQHSLECANIKSVHWAINVKNREYLHHVDRYKPSLVCIGTLIQWAKKENLPLLHYLPEFDAFTQMDVNLSQDLNYWPQFEDIPVLDQQYPGSKFIFNTRPLDRWISSVNRWYTMRRRLTDLEIPGLPKGIGGLDKHLMDWHNWHQQNMLDYFGGENEKFIIFDIEKDDPQKLAGFLGIENMVWERKNVNEKFPEKALRCQINP